MDEGQSDSGAPPEGEKAAGRPRRKSLAVGFSEWARSILIAFALFLGLRAFLVEAFKIPTGSMEGTLLVGDFLLVNKAVFGAKIPGTGLRLPGFAEPERGDVVVFTPPHDPVRSYVKRLVGVPGDTLEMVDKALWVNGEQMAEPYIRLSDHRGDALHPRMSWQSNHLLANSSPGYRPTRDNWGPIVVPNEQFFVLGDNRDNSEDSRYWGFVPRRSIRGRPMFVYYSFQSAVSSERRWAGSVRWGRIGRAIR